MNIIGWIFIWSVNSNFCDDTNNYSQIIVIMKLYKQMHKQMTTAKAGGQYLEYARPNYKQ